MFSKSRFMPISIHDVDFLTNRKRLQLGGGACNCHEKETNPSYFAQPVGYRAAREPLRQPGMLHSAYPRWKQVVHYKIDRANSYLLWASV